MGELWRTLVRSISHGRSTTSGPRLRTFVVPPDIIPVHRRSPVPLRKRTPWRPRPDGEAIQRGGDREWFGDHIFVEPQRGHAGTGYGTSITLHSVYLVAVVIGVLTRPEQLLRPGAGRSLAMPIIVTAAAEAAAPPAPESAPRRAEKPSPPRPAAARVSTASPEAAPVEAPSGIQPELGFEETEDGHGTGGAGDGADGGQPGGTGSSGVGSPGPMRLGGGVVAPVKIKHVKPVFPEGALTGQTRGTVVIEATIGVDGKVHETEVVHSVPALDQAALDAVRQWEYSPALFNGVRVAVIMTIQVQFAIY